ncbi:uncharacterized protein FIBRA_01536 [Fibroporia radiculosa]|uniref:Cytochrome P450 n=1 Tax=Fibroporia radiculosa TaxID=599839 RepID=J4G116_9APHY|nr:uncharacterized protein FIBRA_01536 [Fibroporia radiculosa]CCL99518.1 predicted protein [Fibroporia radiculosa]
MFDTSLWTSLLLVGAVCLLVNYVHGRRARSTLNNIPGPPPSSLWVGNLGQYFARHGSEFQRHIAQDYGPVTKVHGRFNSPILYVSDPKALHTIVVKEEHIFQNSEATQSTRHIMLGPGLLSMQGEKHRKQRKLLNPAFSIKHMRYMLPIFYQVVDKLRVAIERQVASGPQEIDMLNWMSRTALELIGQGGLGYSFDPLVEDVKNDYGDALKSIVPNLGKILPMVRLVLPFIVRLGPAKFRRSIVDRIPHEEVQAVKNTVDTMDRRSREIYEEKKAAIRHGDEAVLQQMGEGKDIMSILMNANTTTSADDRLTEDELIAQMSTFVFAATDTTSNALARILQCLAERPDVQDKLRAELLEAGAGGSLSYDELDQLPLLDSVCRETLRLYPPVRTLTRNANQDTVLPLSEPVVGIDGSLVQEIPVPKGTTVMIGILGCNTRKAVWGEDADEWKPERWLSPLPGTVTKTTIPGVYSNLMTFIGGKRACIGFKFSEMEMKVVLSGLLTSFTFSLSDKPIQWIAAGIRYPSVDKEGKIPQMPLKVGIFTGAKA